MNQMSTLPVDIPQDCHTYSHLTSHWRSLSQIHHLHQVPLPVDIPPQYNQIKHQRNPLILSPSNKSPNFLPSPFPNHNTSVGPILDYNYSQIVFPSFITNSNSQNILHCPEQYVLPRSSPSVPYTMTCFIPDTVFFPSDLSSMSPPKELSEDTISAPFSPPIFSPF